MNSNPLLSVSKNKITEQEAETRRRSELMDAQPGSDDNIFTSLSKWLARLNSNRRRMVFLACTALLAGGGTLYTTAYTTHSPFISSDQSHQVELAPSSLDIIWSDPSLRHTANNATSRSLLGIKREILLTKTTPPTRVIVCTVTEPTRADYIDMVKRIYIKKKDPKYGHTRLQNVFAYTSDPVFAVLTKSTRTISGIPWLKLRFSSFSSSNQKSR